MNNCYSVYTIPRCGSHFIIYFIIGCIESTIDGGIVFKNCIRLNTDGKVSNKENFGNFKKGHKATVDSYEAPYAQASQITCKLNPIIVVRDPFNYIASSIKGHINFISLGRHKQYIELFDYIEKTKDQYLLVKYNDFKNSQEYRKDVINKLALNYDERYLNKLSRHGYASSFDKVSYANRASCMETNKRWKQMIGNDKYINVFKQNPVLIDIGIKHFGMEDAAKKIKEKIK